MASSDILINIVGEFNRKGFDQADRAFGKLEKNAKSLGRTLGLTFSAAAIIGYSKKAVAAANADIKSQRLLTQSLKNVGLAYASVDVENFIQRLQTQTGILDDELRPAFAQLAQVTGSVSRSQELLALAFDVSAGSGKDINAVVDTLTRAFLGNTKGLKSLNLAYTDAELKAMSFNEIVTALSTQYAGQGAASLQGFEGQMRLLSVAAANATETIGVSLINALQTLSADNSIETTTKKMEDFGKSIANNITGIAYLIDQIGRIPGAGVLGNIFGFIEDRISFFSPSNAANLLKQIQGFGGMGNISMTKSSQDTQKAMIEAAAKAEAAALARQKAILAALQKQTKEQEKQKRLRQISAMLAQKESKFDLQRIQLAAAAQGKISEDERNRIAQLQTIEELKAAIATDDLNKAEELLTKLTVLQEKTVKLSESLVTFPKANDPFIDWTTTLTSVQAQLLAIAQKKIVVDFLANFSPISSAAITAITKPSAASSAAAVATNPAAAAAAAATDAAVAAASADAAAAQAAADLAAAEAAIAAAEAAAALAAAKNAEEKAAAEAFAKAAAAAAEAAKVLEESAAAMAAEAARAAAEAAAAEAAEAERIAALLEAEAAAKAAADALAAASIEFDASVISAIASGAQPITTITVNVEGSVTAVEDLAQTIIDIQYENQRNGTSPLFSSIAI